MPDELYPDEDQDFSGSEREINELLTNQDDLASTDIKSEPSEQDLNFLPHPIAKDGTKISVTRRMSSRLKRERSESTASESKTSLDLGHNMGRDTDLLQSPKRKRVQTIGVRYDVDSLVDLTLQEVEPIDRRTELKDLEDIRFKFKKPKHAGALHGIRVEILQKVPNFLVETPMEEKHSSDLVSLKSEWKRYMLVWAFGFSLVTVWSDGWLLPSPNSIIKGLFLTPAWNPCLPSRVGEAGIWLHSDNKPKWSKSLFTMDNNNLWHYKGEYQLSPRRKLKSQEWRSLEPEVRNKWLHGIFWEERFEEKRAQVRLCLGENIPTAEALEASIQDERIRLLSLSPVQRKTYRDRCEAQRLNMETIKHSLDHGNVKLWLIVLKCFGYKHELLTLLHDTRRRWVAAGRPKSTRPDIAEAKAGARLQTRATLPKKEEAVKNEEGTVKLQPKFKRRRHKIKQEKV